jgi:hypothetical protein
MVLVFDKQRIVVGRACGLFLSILHPLL